MIVRQLVGAVINLQVHWYQCQGQVVFEVTRNITKYIYAIFIYYAICCTSICLPNALASSPPLPLSIPTNTRVCISYDKQTSYARCSHAFKVTCTEKICIQKSKRYSAFYYISVQLFRVIRLVIRVAIITSVTMGLFRNSIRM